MTKAVLLFVTTRIEAETRKISICWGIPRNTTSATARRKKETKRPFAENFGCCNSRVVYHDEQVVYHDERGDR